MVALDSNIVQEEEEGKNGEKRHKEKGKERLKTRLSLPFPPDLET